MPQLTSHNGVLPLSLGVVYTDSLFINGSSLPDPAPLGEILYNGNGVIASSPNLTYDSDSGTLHTLYLAAAEPLEDVTILNSTEGGNINFICKSGSDIQLFGGAVAIYYGASLALLPTSDGFGGAIRIMAGQFMDVGFDLNPSSTLSGTVELLAGASTPGNAICRMTGVPSGSLTIKGGDASGGSSTNGGSVTITSTAGSISLRAGALADPTESQQGSIYITANSAGLGTAGSLKIISNEITYIWPSTVTAAANASLMLVTTSSPPIATLSFVPVTGDATITNAGVLTIGAVKVLTAHFATNSVDATKFGPKSVTASKIVSTAVTAGSYTHTNLTVNAQGQLTAASSGTTLGYIQASISANATYTVGGTDIIQFNTVQYSTTGFSLASGVFTVPINRTIMITVLVRANPPAFGEWEIVNGDSGASIANPGAGIHTEANGRPVYDSANAITNMIFVTSTGNNSFKVKFTFGPDPVEIVAGSVFSIIEI